MVELRADEAPREKGPAWVARFHAGDRAVLEACYREHFDTVHGAVGRCLAGADRETAVHEVFFRLMTNEGLRRSYSDGSFAAWLATVARNHAIDQFRRRRFEQPAGITPPDTAVSRDFEARAEARLLIQRFRNEHLPAAWDRVFEARFLLQLDQSEAARRLGMRRTTLAYQEYRIRRLLRRFVLLAERQPPPAVATKARGRS